MVSSKTSFMSYVAGALTVTLRDENGKEPVGWLDRPICCLADAEAQPYITADVAPPAMGHILFKFGANHLTVSDMGSGSALALTFDDFGDATPWPAFSDADNPGAFTGGNFHARIGIICDDGILVSDVLTIAVTA